MIDYTHSLAAELPEHKQSIHSLKVENKQFAKLMDEYDALDKKVLHIEQGGQAISDAAFEALKKDRLALKDQLFKIIREHEKK